MGKNDISRRDFLRTMAASGAAVAGLSACAGKPENASGAEGSGTMTFRTNPNTGDKVSLLGFGMMRLPFIKDKKAEDGRGVIDQEEVNHLVDYAMEHGVNYFDTSPAYCQGLSEESTGIALGRYPRDSYFIATKISNFSESTHSFGASKEMYLNSLKYLSSLSFKSITCKQSFNICYLKVLANQHILWYLKAKSTIYLGGDCFMKKR